MVKIKQFLVVINMVVKIKQCLVVINTVVKIKQFLVVINTVKSIGRRVLRYGINTVRRVLAGQKKLEALRAVTLASNALLRQHYELKPQASNAQTPTD